MAQRIHGHMRAVLQRDWLLVGGGGLRRARGLCSVWYRGRNPRLSRAAFVERWCHRGCCARCQRKGWGDPLYLRAPQLQCRCHCEAPTAVRQTHHTYHQRSAVHLTVALSHPDCCPRALWAPHPLQVPSAHTGRRLDPTAGPLGYQGGGGDQFSSTFTLRLLLLCFLTLTIHLAIPSCCPILHSHAAVLPPHPRVCITH